MTAYLSMDNRIASFDYVRVVSLFGILLCHHLFELNGWGWLGRYFALTFNFLFLVLSAFLMGMAWDKRCRKPYDRSFVTRRIGKLSKSYYPYLVVLFFFLYVSQGDFSWRKVISHAAYLPWFDKIEGFGHLWFMTMIALCYVGCWLVTKLRIGVFKRKLLICSIIIGGGILDYAIDRVGMPGYIFPYLIGYLLIFNYAGKVLALIGRIRMPVNITQFIVINAGALALFHAGIFEHYRVAAYLSGMVSAMSVICLLLNVCREMPSSRVIVWLSGISFEIYLVHEFFLGRYSVNSYIDHPLLAFAALVALSATAAVLLKAAVRLPAVIKTKRYERA